MKSSFCFCLFLLTRLTVHSQDHSLFQKKTFTRHAQILQYRILYPVSYDPHKAYPLVIFLHGSGNIGNDNESQLQHGASLFLADSNRQKYPAIVIFPQCPPGQVWSYFKFGYDSGQHKMFMRFPFNSNQPVVSQLVKALADSLVDQKTVDASRIYLGGLSLGGFGTFDLMERYPGFFAAAFPICGGGDTAMAAGVAASHIAVWIFHGEKDPLVSVQNSRDFYHALTSAGGNVQYTEYPGVKHNAWDYAFKEPALLSWLFAQHAYRQTAKR